MSIFDVLTNGSLGSVISSMTQGRSDAGGGGFGGFGGSGGLGGGIGSVLDTLGKAAKSAASNIQENTPGGIGGLAGAGALGALLGNVLHGDVMKSVALAGAGAVAWNFYKKWAAQQQGAKNTEVVSPASHPEALSSGDHEAIPGFGDASAQSKTPVKTVDPTAELIMRSMVYAARADGAIDPTEKHRIEEILSNILPGQDVSDQLAAMRKESIDPAKIAKEVTSPEQGKDVYRLSCSVIDIDHFMEQSYLQALATALGIDAAEKKRLEDEAAQARKQLHAMIEQAQ